MCIASDVSLTIANVVAAMGFPGISIEVTRLAMDKLAMKDKFRKEGIAIPDYAQLSNIEDLKNLINNWGYPLVIKPVDGRGARGVLRLTDGIDIDWAWGQSKENSLTSRVMVEKFLDGPQVSTESMMIDGRCYTLGFSDRNYEYLEKYAPYIIENGGDLPSHLPNEIQNQVKELVEKAALSMGIENGIVKGDIVVHKGKPFVIELAARLSGGYFCTHEIPLNTGVDLVGNAIKMAIGEKINPDDLIPRFNKPVSQRYFFPEKGVLDEIVGLDDAMNRAAVEFIDIRVKPGDIIPEQISHPSRAGLVITTGETKNEATAAAIDAINSVTFVVS